MTFCPHLHRVCSEKGGKTPSLVERISVNFSCFRFPTEYFQCDRCETLIQLREGTVDEAFVFRTKNISQFPPNCIDSCVKISCFIGSKLSARTYVTRAIRIPPIGEQAMTTNDDMEAFNLHSSVLLHLIHRH